MELGSPSPAQERQMAGPLTWSPSEAQALWGLLARPGSSCCLRSQEGRVHTWAGTLGGTTGLTQAAAGGGGRKPGGPYPREGLTWRRGRGPGPAAGLGLGTFTVPPTLGLAPRGGPGLTVWGLGGPIHSPCLALASICSFPMPAAGLPQGWLGSTASPQGGWGSTLCWEVGAIIY